jgi:Sec-independent protein translocase protein TatA
MLTVLGATPQELALVTVLLVLVLFHGALPKIGDILSHLFKQHQPDHKDDDEESEESSG